MLDTKKIRKDFPILKRKYHGHPLVYFDNGATSQKPKQVIKAISDFYFLHNANINRSAHFLGEEATQMYEEARLEVANFIGAESSKEIIFVRNSTEAINLVAYAWGRKNILEGDEIITTEMEHHSNLVPWQVLAKEKKAKLKFIPFDKDGFLDLSMLSKLVTKKTKIVSLVHVSNMLGTINPIKKIIKMVKEINPQTLVLVDGSQSVQHLPVFVKDLDGDFFAFTGHKMLGPLGIGVLWAKEKILSEMPPFLSGGDMIKEVYLDHVTWNELPEKFEAGTPNVEGAIGLAEAIRYLNKLGMTEIRKHEIELVKYILAKLSKIPEITVYGPKNPDLRGGLVSFNIKGIHPHDVSQVFSNQGICVRAGHHCTMPLHQKLNIPASVRASFYIYNTKEEIDLMIEAINKVIRIFKVS